MATDLERLVVSLDANVTGLTRKLAAATGDLDGFGRRADASTRSAAQAIGRNLGGVKVSGISGLDKISAGMTVVGRDAARAAALSQAGAEKMRAGFAASVAAAAASRAGAAAAGRAAALQGYELRNLSFQLNDAITQIATGSSVFQTVAAQGGQVFQVLQGAQGGVGGALKDIGSRLIGLVTPARIMGAAAVGSAALAAAAFAKWQAQTDSLSDSLNGLGRRTGLGVSGLAAAAEAGRKQAAGGAFGSISSFQSRDLAGGFARAGISGSNIPGAVGVTKTFAGVTGQSLEDAGAQIAKMLADPKAALDELERSLGSVNQATRTAVERAVANGDAQQAQALIVAELTKQLQGASPAVNDIAKAFREAETKVSDFVAWLGRQVARTFSAPSDEEALGAARAKKAQSERYLSIPGLKLIPGLYDAAKKDLEDANAEIARIEKAQGDKDAARAKAKAENDAAEASKRQKAVDDLTKADELAVAAISAVTVAQRAAIAAEQARTEAVKSGASDAYAAAAAQGAYNRVMAEAAKQAREAMRDAKEGLELAGLKPADRARRQIELERRRNQEQIDTPGGGVSVQPYSPGPGSGSGYGGLFTKSEVVGMIRTAAKKYGIDPDTAVAVARSEGLSGYVGDRGTSFGPYQLHYKNNIPGLSNGGLGDTFTKQTGLDARNPATTPQQIDFALRMAKELGWTPWHGAANTGVGKWQGIGRTVAAAPAGAIELSPVDVDVPTPPRRSTAGAAPAAIGPRPSDVIAGDKTAALDKERAAEIREQNEAIQERARALGLEKAAWGQNAAAQAAALEKERLLNEERRRSDGPISAERMAQIDTQAAQVGQVAGAEDQFHKLKAASDQFSDSLADGLVNVAFNGGKVQDVLKGIAAQLASMALRSAFQSMFAGAFGGGGNSGGGGGLFGLLTGGGGSGFGFHFAEGGAVAGPGGSKSDAVPAMLSAGEFVVNAAATSRNRALLHAINAGGRAHFADGGPVGVPAATRPATSGGLAIHNSTTMNVTPANGVTPEQLAVVIERNNRQRDRAIGQTMNNWQSRYA